MKSTNGYISTLGGAVSWKSSKKTCITLSTMEAEFIALEKASSKAEWLINILLDIPLWMIPTSLVSMCCDSQDAIAQVKSKMFNGKNMHIRLRHNIVRQLLETGVIDESKTQIFKPIFQVYFKLKSSVKCKIMELSPRFMFCRKLRKRSIIQQKKKHKSTLCKKRVNVVTSYFQCSDTVIRRS